MSTLTSQQLALLRSRPHSTKLWLSIYKPATVLACQVNDAAIAVGAYQITYNNVTAGSDGDVQAGMTLLVGTAPGKGDRGKVRVKAANATTIELAQNSHIQWADDLYLTVIAFFEPWTVYPRYIRQGTTVTWYKDYDVAYTNQNTVLGSFICMGDHYAGFKEFPVYYTATGTSNVIGDSLTYAWEFEGGSPATSNVETPGNVTYSTPGHYTTKLTVFNSSGYNDISFRHISIYDRPEQGTSVPVLKWEMDTLDGNREEGGYATTIKIHEPCSAVVDGALVVIFGDDIYGTTKQSIGGFFPNRERVFFVGYILDDSIKYDYQTSSVEFEVASFVERMKMMDMVSVSLDSASNPVTASALANQNAGMITDSPWNYVQSMTVKKALYHYLKFHSTVLNAVDFQYLGADYEVQYFETDPASLYDALNTALKTKLIASLISDAQGKMWIQVGPETIHNKSVIHYGMSLTRQDWMGEPEIRDVPDYPLAFLSMGGVAYSGAGTGTSTEYIASAPGSTRGYLGKLDDRQGLILTSQAMLNTLVGDVYAYENSRYPDITMQLVGNYRNLDIVPLERQLLTINASDTQKGISFTDRPFHITDISWEYDPVAQTLLPEITLHDLPTGYDGVAEEIEQPPVDNYPDQPPPDTTLPPFPDIPPIGPPIPPPPWIPYPPPPTASDCPSDVNAPANGPYDLFTHGTLRSDTPYDGDVVTNYELAAPYNCIIRMGAAVNKTTVKVNGCWEKSTDGGATWTAWTDNVGWYIRAQGVSMAGNHNSIDATLNTPGGAACEVRSGYFSPANPYYLAGNIYIGITPIATYTRSCSGYTAVGPFSIRCDNPSTVTNIHNGTTIVGPIGSGLTFMLCMFRFTSATVLGGSQTCDLWNSATDDTCLQNDWYCNGFGNAPGVPSGVLDCLFPEGWTSQVHPATHHAWDGSGTKSCKLLVETGSMAYDWTGEFYLIFHDALSPLKRLRVYGATIENICSFPTY